MRWISRRRSSGISGLSASARETVDIETFAKRATSAIFKGPSSATTRLLLRVQGLLKLPALSENRFESEPQFMQPISA
jgi:hypothetical protein